MAGWWEGELAGCEVQGGASDEGTEGLDGGYLRSALALRTFTGNRSASWVVPRQPRVGYGRTGGG